MLQVAAGLVPGRLGTAFLKAAMNPRSVPSAEQGMDLSQPLPKIPGIPSRPDVSDQDTAIAPGESVSPSTSGNSWTHGTHIDAHCHFIADTQTVDSFPCATIVPAAVIDSAGAQE